MISSSSPALERGLDTMVLVYNPAPHKSSPKVAAGPVVLLYFDPADVTTIFGLSDTHALDLTDAVLLHLAQRNGAGYLATDDQRLSLACSQLGIQALSPLDAVLRQAVGAWEGARRACRACCAACTSG